MFCYSERQIKWVKFVKLIIGVLLINSAALVLELSWDNRAQPVRNYLGIFFDL